MPTALAATAPRRERAPRDLPSGLVYVTDERPGIRCIATRSTATDHIDLAACRARGIVVVRVPDYGETTVAEHTFALILALSRRLRKNIAHLQVMDACKCRAVVTIALGRKC